MESLVVLAGSAAVIALMIGAAALLGFHKSERIADEAQFAALIAAAEPGARLDAAAIGSDGRAALARLADGRLAAALVMGDRITLRFAPASAVKVSVERHRVAARFADVGFPSLNLVLEDTPAWLAALAEQGAKT